MNSMKTICQIFFIRDKGLNRIEATMVKKTHENNTNNVQVKQKYQTAQIILPCFYSIILIDKQFCTSAKTVSYFAETNKLYAGDANMFSS